MCIRDSLYDDDRAPVEHSRWTWPVDAVRISDYYSYPGRSSHDDVPGGLAERVDDDRRGN